MEANSKKNQSLFPARFLFSTTREQMTALDTLTNSIHGADRLSVARAALSVGLAFIEVTGVAPLTSKAAKEAAKEMTEDKMGTLITVYRGHDLREGPARRGVEIFHAGESVGYEVSVALAKSWIDVQMAKANPAKPEQPAERASNDTHSPAMPTAERKALNAKRMGRFENNPDDLV